MWEVFQNSPRPTRRSSLYPGRAGSARPDLA
jgi:hypothetical protein